MWPFNKPKKSTQVSSLPEEVQRYYDAEERDRNGTTWLLAAGTLVATVIIAVGLFFGGRWLITTIFGDDDTNTGITTSQTSSTSTQSSDDQENSGSQNEESTAATSATDQGDSETSSQPSSPSSSADSTTTTTQTPSTGSTSGPLPNTGPSGPLL